jgi:hypothetical protein
MSNVAAAPVRITGTVCCNTLLIFVRVRNSLLKKERAITITSRIQNVTRL